MTGAAPRGAPRGAPADDAAGMTLPAHARIDVSRIDRFKLDAEIGRGGMATVYAALDSESGQRVALKLLQRGVDDDVRARFHREVKAASSLVHPGICRVVAFGDGDDGAPFLAMELIQGHTLASLAKKWPLVPAAVSAEILRQLLEALACAHDAGVIHRDLKPQNVMITSTGQVKLLDFGIARSLDDETITKSGVLVGTPAFMSPEQARSETLDARSDLFSAALTLAALVRRSSHRFAGSGLDPTQMLLRVAYEPLGPLFEQAHDVPLALDFFIARMTKLIREHRYGDAHEALRALAATALLPADGPATLAAFVKDPSGAGARLLREQQQRELACADDVEGKPGGTVAAALALHRAASLEQHLDGDGGAVAVRLRVLCAKNKLKLDDAVPKGAEGDDDKLRELLRSFRDNPTHPGVLKALAERHKALGYAKAGAAFLWRYVVEKPEDTHAAQQLQVMLEGPVAVDAPAPTPAELASGVFTGSHANGRAAERGERVERLSTRSIVAGVKTGGLKRTVPASAAPSLPRSSPQRAAASSTSTLAAPAGPSRAAAASGTAPIVIASAARAVDGPASSPWLSRTLLIAIIACAFGFAFIMIANGFKLTRDALDQSAPPATSANGASGEERVRVVEQSASTLSRAQDALRAGDAPEAALLASEVLQKKPSLEAGRTALWVRAQAQARLGQRDAALADCELYLAKATDFDDPHLADVKKLMAELRAASTPAKVRE